MLQKQKKHSNQVRSIKAGTYRMYSYVQGMLVFHVEVRTLCIYASVVLVEVYVKARKTTALAMLVYDTSRACCMPNYRERTALL